MPATDLLSKLKAINSNSKAKKSIDIDSNFGTLTDEEITLVLAHRSQKLRLDNKLKQTDFSKLAQLSSPTTYSNFEQTGKASLLNFIKIVRALGRLSEMDNLLKVTIAAKIDNLESKKKAVKRIR